MARGLKFCIYEVDGCTIYVAKTKALISFVITVKLICVFAFAYAKIRFSHDAAQMITENLCCEYSLESAHHAVTYIEGAQLNCFED